MKNVCGRSVLPLICGLLALSSPAWAHPPLVATDDAAVLARGECELDGGFGRVRESGLRGRAQGLGVGCGVGAATQAALAWSRQRGSVHAGDALDLVGKTGLAQHGELALSLGWGLGWQRAGSGALRQQTASLALLASRPLAGPLTLHANVGVAHARGDGARATWALATELATGLGVDLTAEVFGQDGRRPGQALGLRWPLNERLRVHAALARSSGTGDAPALSAGFVLGF